MHGFISRAWNRPEILRISVAQNRPGFNRKDGIVRVLFAGRSMFRLSDSAPSPRGVGSVPHTRSRAPSCSLSGSSPAPHNEKPRTLCEVRGSRKGLKRRVQPKHSDDHVIAAGRRAAVVKTAGLTSLLSLVYRIGRQICIGNCNRNIVFCLKTTKINEHLCEKIQSDRPAAEPISSPAKDGNSEKSAWLVGFSAREE